MYDFSQSHNTFFDICGELENKSASGVAKITCSITNYSAAFIGAEYINNGTFIRITAIGVVGSDQPPVLNMGNGSTSVHFTRTQRYNSDLDTYIFQDPVFTDAEKEEIRNNITISGVSNGTSYYTYTATMTFLNPPGVSSPSAYRRFYVENFVGARNVWVEYSGWTGYFDGTGGTGVSDITEPVYPCQKVLPEYGARIFPQLTTFYKYNITPYDGSGTTIFGWLLTVAYEQYLKPFGNKAGTIWDIYLDGEDQYMDVTIVTNTSGYEENEVKYYLKVKQINGTIELENEKEIYPTETTTLGAIIDWLYDSLNKNPPALGVYEGNIHLTFTTTIDGEKGDSFEFILPQTLPDSPDDININKEDALQDVSELFIHFGLYQEEDFEDPDEESDEIEDSTGYSTAGLLTRTYALNKNRINQLGGHLWSDDFIKNIMLLNNSPIDNIVSCKVFPKNISGTDAEIVCGNVPMGVNGLLVSETWEGFKSVIGSIPVLGFYNSFLDYEPYTKLTIWLPFIGFKELDCNLYMNRTITVTYIIDLITGACKAVLKADNTPTDSFDGSMGIDVPLTSTNRSQVEAGYLSSFISAVSQPTPTNIASHVLESATNQFHSTHTAGASPSCAAYETRDIFLIYDRPTFQDVKEFYHTHGRMCNLSRRIGGLSGFTRTASDVDLSGIPCTSIEREMIRSILSSGFFV